MVAVTVEQPEILVVNGNSEPAGCAGGGSISLTVNGGTAPYTYTWDNGQTTANLSDLFPGSYTVVVTDANGCTQSATISVGGGTDLSASATTSPVDCFGASTGSIDLTANGSAQPLTFLWNNGATTEDLSGILAGNYSVTVTDDNGCSEVVAVTVEQPIALLITLDDSSDPSCYGESNGYLFVSADGGSENYSFTWSDGQDGPEAVNLEYGSYTVTVTDDNGCSLAETYLLTPPAEWVALDSLVGDTALCAVGSLHYDLGDLPAAETIRWTLPDENTVDGAALTATQTGLYHLDVQTADGCTYHEEFTVLFTNEEDFQVAFLLPQRAVINDPTIAIDISWPRPDSIRWFFDEATVLNGGITANQQILEFPETGTYRIGLEAYLDGCVGYREELIQVFSERDSLHIPGGLQTGADILSADLSPNPHQGNFTVQASLREAMPASIFLFSANGELLHRKDLEATDQITEYYSRPDLPPGVQTLVIRTENGMVYLRHLKTR